MLGLQQQLTKKTLGDQIYFKPILDADTLPACSQISNPSRDWESYLGLGS